MENHDAVPQPEPELSLSQWLKSNGPTLTIVVALFVYLFVKFDSDGLWAIAKAALGLSFVIFVHELGHFLVAKWCDVHVTVFSIGFGPPLPGCSHQWGETTYKLALFPLGGYVQMVGQVDGSEESDGSEEDPRSYRNKGVWQRMAIISAGVVMNAILAIICFIVVFLIPGKDRLAAVVAQADTGAPAFVHGLRTGAEILQIGHVKNPYFDDLKVIVATTEHGQKLPLAFKRPGDKEITFLEIEPRKDNEDATPLIGISFPYRLELAPRRAMEKGVEHPAFRGSPADQAQPPLHFEDRIIGMTDPDTPAQVTELPIDPRYPTGKQRDYFEFARRMNLLAGQEVTLRVQRGDQTVDAKVPPAFHRSLGVRMPMGQITVVRLQSPAAAAGVQARDKVNNREGDRIVKVELPEADGKKTIYEGDSLDSLRLPFQLRQWADRQAKKSPQKGEKKVVTLHVQRHKALPGEQYEKVKVQVDWDDDWRFDNAVPFGLASPLAIPELGIAYQVPTTVADADPNWNPSSGERLQKGDVLQAIRFYFGGAPTREDKWIDLKAEQWAGAWYLLQTPAEVKEVALKVKRDKEVKEIKLTPTADSSWPLASRGFIFMRDVRRQKADDLFEAIAMGFKDTHTSMMGIYQSLRGMVTRRIDPMKNLGGPFTIAYQAFQVAGYDFWEFVFFIGLISINLAVINFLPIPVLDGGHMVFLIYEKIRGKPASEGVRVGATYAGLALILGLMVFVLYLDISRMF